MEFCKQQAKWIIQVEEKPLPTKQVNLQEVYEMVVKRL